MFGYINVNKKELTEEQKNQYQSYYCGLCRSLSGQCSKMCQVVLQEDMTFLVLLLSGLYEPVNVKEEFTCLRHPVKKKVARGNEASEYVAKMNVLLAYQNFRDDWIDDRSIYKRCLMSMLKQDYNRIKEEYPRQAKAIEHCMDKLTIAEQANESNLDAVAGITGEMLGEIFNWKDDEWADELKGIGFHMGKFIYIMDAYLDLKKDEKEGKYNPFSFVRRENMSDAELATYARLILNSLMTECEKAFERLPITKQADLIKNVIKSGVWMKFDA